MLLKHNYLIERKDMGDLATSMDPKLCGSKRISFISEYLWRKTKQKGKFYRYPQCIGKSRYLKQKTKLKV